jgi:hypothetical protein
MCAIDTLSKWNKKYADIDVAKYFNHETDIPEQIGIKPFAFHNYGYPGYMNYDYQNLKINYDNK